MASNVFPMLSSSPPPIDDCPDDDDDDDEFGNFTSANIPFDSSFDSPVVSDKFKTFKAAENGANDINLENDLNEFHYKYSETPPLQEFVHSLSENQSNEDVCCKKSDSAELSCENNCPFSLEHPSSVNEFPPHGKSNLVSSHNFVPDLCDSTYEVENSHGACNDSNCVNSFELPNCSSNGNTCDELDASHVREVLEDKENWIPFPEASNALNDFGESEELSCIHQNSHSETPGDKSECENIFYSEKLENNCENASDIIIPPFRKSYYTKSDFTAGSCSPDNYSYNNCEDFDEFQQAGFGYDICDDSGTSAADFKKLSLESGISEETSVVLNQCSSDLHTNETFHQHHESDDFDDYESSRLTVCDSADLKNGTSLNYEAEYNNIKDCRHTAVSDQEFNDFADFQNFDEVETNVDDFADFETAPFESNNQFKQSESCEFADFESAQFGSSCENASVLASSCHASAIVQEKSADKLSTVINTIFPIPDGPSTVDAADEPVSEILEQSNKSRRLWEKLHEIEQTPGLRFQWGVSHSFQQLLRSVNVDYHSILRTSSVPIFASSLSLLEPVKGHSSSANCEPEDRNLSPRDPIPPVEFDWNSSGLINPLDSGQAVSTLMDLSFLSSSATDGSITSGDHSFENELLKPSPLPSYSENSEKPHILEQLLSKNVSSLPNSKVSHRPSNLSGEAVRVLDQLPDLSFMQAKVLMFPISSKT